MEKENVSAVRIRSDIAAMAGYSFSSGTLEILSERYGRPIEEIIKLDTNENPYGASPAVAPALAKLNAEIHTYPDHQSVHLRQSLSDFLGGVPPEHIFVGAGSDQVIELIVKLFMQPGDTLLNCPPTFTIYTLYVEWAGNCRVVNVPRLADFSLDVEAIEKAAYESGAKLLFISNPNNPDGSLTPAATIERLLKLPLTVVLDEAYNEFTDMPSFAARVPETPNLIVLRTFSKWAGLAGLRVGYGVFPLEVIEHLWKIKPPFNVTAAADMAARATLQDLTPLWESVSKIKAERTRLMAELGKVPYLKPFPSAGNFIFCQVEGIEIETLRETLEAEAILIRYYEKFKPLSCIRITVGKPEHSDAVLRVLRRLGERHA